MKLGYLQWSSTTAVVALTAASVSASETGLRNMVSRELNWDVDGWSAPTTDDWSSGWQDDAWSAPVSSGSSGSSGKSGKSGSSGSSGKSGKSGSGKSGKSGSGSCGSGKSGKSGSGCYEEVEKEKPMPPKDYYHTHGHWVWVADVKEEESESSGKSGKGSKSSKSSSAKSGKSGSAKSGKSSSAKSGKSSSGKSGKSSYDGDDDDDDDYAPVWYGGAWGGWGGPGPWVGGWENDGWSGPEPKPSLSSGKSGKSGSGSGKSGKSGSGSGKSGKSGSGSEDMKPVPGWGGHWGKPYPVPGWGGHWGPPAGDDDDDDDDNFSTFVEGGDSGSQPQSDYSFVQDSIDESTGLPHNEVGSPSSSMSENYDGDGSSLLDEDDSHVSYHREENETSPLSPEAAVPRSAGNAVSENESGNLGTNEVNEGNEVASQENEAIGIGNEENEVPSQQNEEAGVGIGNIEEAGQVVEGASMGEVQITGNNNENDSENVVASEGNVNSEGGGGNDEITNQSIAPLSICDQATSCMDCLNLAIEQLQQGMNYEPCYWVGMDGQQKCAAPSQFIDATNNHQEGAYQCAEGNSAVFTGEGWDVALAAIAAASQVPAEGGGNEENVPYPQQNEQSSGSDNYGDGYYWDDGDDDSFFDMVKSTLNVLALAAFFAGLLVCRSRIRERQRVNPSTGVIGAIKDEIFSLIVAAVSRAASAARDEGHSGSARASDFTVTSSLHSSLSRPEANNFGQETVPLSTATDEEWGWDDDEISTPNLELSGIRTDEAKEEDDLALAIAMSLSESDNAATAPSNGGMKTNLPTKSTVNTVRTAPKSVDKKLQIPKPTTSSRLPAVPMKSQLENQNANVSKPETPPSSGQSIEDLLGQMGGNGGPVITKFGQRPPMEHANAKPLAPKKVETEEDDIFASMGLSNFPTKPAGGVMSTPKPAPSTGGWQASTAFASASAAAAPKSAPLPSLLAATADDLDDADADWGDDGDLDDLLDD
mmetsp:Transcript_17902/g.35948  ORF Transcript_17902/g.35948 Transcript_17902/m.35948 type:complete len:985 (-) Transcript_17902:1932-4886(-)